MKTVSVDAAERAAWAARRGDMIARDGRRDGSKPMSGSHERDAVEPSDAGANVQLPSYEFILVVAPLVELASGATLVQGCNKLLAMPFEEHYRRLSFW
jgi:hypothetical protein